MPPYRCHDGRRPSPTSAEKRPEGVRPPAPKPVPSSGTDVSGKSGSAGWRFIGRCGLDLGAVGSIL